MCDHADGNRELFPCACVCLCVSGGPCHCSERTWACSAASPLPRAWWSACVLPELCLGGLHWSLSSSQRNTSALCASTQQRSTEPRSSVSFANLYLSLLSGCVLSNVSKTLPEPVHSSGVTRFLVCVSDCSSQDEQFSLVFTIASFMNNFMTLLSGFLFDHFGTMVTRFCAVWVQIQNNLQMFPG